MTNPTSALTVAIPTYNGARHLRQTLRSLRSQRELEFDILLSDDCSDDATTEIAREEFGDRISIVVNSERRGLAGNWNHCVQLCQTPLIAILHQDDVLLDGHLARHVRAFQEQSRVGLCASASEVVDENGRSVAESVVGRGGLGNVARIFPPTEALARMVEGNPLRCSAVSLRVSAFREAGGFDPRLLYVVDWDLWIKIGLTNAVAWFPEPTVLVRWHRESETHRFARGTIDLEETRSLMQIALSLLEVEPSVRRAIASRSRRRLARAYLNRVYVAAKTDNAELAHDALRQAFRLDGYSWTRLLRDPILTARLLHLLAIRPRREI